MRICTSYAKSLRDIVQDTASRSANVKSMCLMLYLAVNLTILRLPIPPRVICVLLFSRLKIRFILDWRNNCSKKTVIIELVYLLVI